MTHNVHEKRQPEGAWATPSRTPQGVYGITIGHDDLVIGFVPEAAVEAFIAAAMKVSGDDADLIAMAVYAADKLPKFKAECAMHEKRSAGAPNN
jgi:hypothetical protein